VNLRQAQYCIYNQQHSRAEYERFIAELDLTSHSQRCELKLKFFELAKSQPRPHAHFHNCEDATGNFISASRRVYCSYSIRECEDVKNCFLLYKGAKDCQDLSMFGNGAELMYECLVCGINSLGLRFCDDCWDSCSNLSYCVMCPYSQDLFGCVALRRKRYCILNTQYNQKEFESLMGRIIKHMRETGEWGEFFPVSLSPVSYNRSMAQRYFPLEQQKVSELGGFWKDYEIVSRVEALEASALPDGLPNKDVTIITQGVGSGRAFRITAEEIRRYRAMGIPLPRYPYDERMEKRQETVGGVRLYKNKCAQTGKELLSTYSPDTPWIIWDRDEYEKEFAG